MIKKPDINSKKKLVVQPLKIERYNFCYGFIGINRTGKSATARELAEDWRKSRPDPKFRVISHDPQKRFADITDLFIDPEDEMWAVRCCELRNCLLILDDFKLLNLKNTPVKGLQSLLYYRAEHNVDIIYIVHNPALLINLLTYFTSHYYIFMTMAQEGSFQKKIPNYRLCQAASNQVNEYVRKYGPGKHKKDKEYDGQGFPHVIVDCVDQRLVAVNMEKEVSMELKDYRI